MKELNLQQLRYNLETQFRSNFYQDPKFPYLHSLGIKDLFQSFECDQAEIGFVGILHMWWTNEDNNIIYDTPSTIKPKGIWLSEWLDSSEDGINKALLLQKNKFNIFNPEAIIEALVKVNMKIAERHQKKQLRRVQEEDSEEEIPTYMLN